MIRNYRRMIGLAAMAVIAAACSDSTAVRMRYQIEKSLHEAEKLRADLQVAPELATEADYDRILSEYQDAIRLSFMALDSVSRAEDSLEFFMINELAFRSVSRAGQIYFAREEYDSSVQLLSRLLERASLRRVQAMNVRVNLGEALQASGNWDSALAVYDRTVESFYPPVNAGGEVVLGVFNLPSRIHSTYRRVRDTAGAAERFNRAEAYYLNLAAEYPESNLETAAHANLSRLYEDAGEYGKQVAELNYMVDSTGQVVMQARLKIADLYATRLNRRAEALTIYDDVMAGLTGDDTLFAPAIMLKKALVHLAAKRYQTARQLLVDIEQNHRRFYAGYPTAQLAKAQTFDREGNWQRAEDEYRVLIENYEGSHQAMSTYLYLAEHYKKEGLTREADRWYEEADAAFTRQAVQSSGTQAEATALLYRAYLYRQKEEWQRAAEVLQSIYSKFPDAPAGIRAMVLAAEVHRDKLGQPSKADSLLNVVRSAMAEVSEESGLPDPTAPLDVED
jgi:tetratricopeptide (TPR) repeat protein